MEYTKWDPMVKKMIMITGNRNLFPELKIPKTTIDYWLRDSKEKVTSEVDHAYERVIKSQKKAIFELKAKCAVVSRCLEKLVCESGAYDKRSKKVNEIWHIDITVLEYGENDTTYLQLLVDNYSRMIVAWKLSRRKTMDVTYKTILKSFLKGIFAFRTQWLKQCLGSLSRSFI